jgi:F-type H+-transporting ATPase subunit a
MHNALEALILYVRDEVARPNIGAKADKYVPFLLSLWFLILGANLIGLIPLSVTSTANINVTAVLALFTFFVVQVNGTKDYWQHILWPPGIPTWVKFMLVPVEILGLFIKPFVLAVRLFANMTAGHLVILSFIGLIFTFKGLFGAVGGFGVAPVSVAFALFIYLIEILVAFLQAYIFVMLSALYIGAAVEEHEHHGNHDADSEHVPAMIEATSTNGVGAVVGHHAKPVVAS